MNKLKEHSLDVIKTTLAVMPVPLKIFGILVADWVLILSALVSIVILIEKLPMLIRRVKDFVSWIKKVKKN